MYFSAVLILAVLVGWLATLIMQTDIQKVSILNFTIAIAGAALGGGILAPHLGIATIDQYGFSASGILVSWLAAMLLLVTTNLIRRGSLR